MPYPMAATVPKGNQQTMSVIFSAGMEGGSTAEWTAVQNSGTDLTAAAAAALRGTGYGISVVCDDTNSKYCYKSGLNSSTGVVRVRVYVDINSLTMTTGNEFAFIFLKNAAAASLAQVRIVKATTDYKMYAFMYNDAAGTSDTSPYIVTDAPHCVEFILRRATSNVASDGTCSFYVDGALKETRTGVDNYDRFDVMDYISVGMATANPAGTTGTLYVDEVIVNNDGLEIGG